MKRLITALVLFRLFYLPAAPPKQGSPESAATAGGAAAATLISIIPEDADFGG